MNCLQAFCSTDASSVELGPAKGSRRRSNEKELTEEGGSVTFECEGCGNVFKENKDNVDNAGTREPLVNRQG